MAGFMSQPRNSRTGRYEPKPKRQPQSGQRVDYTGQPCTACGNSLASATGQNGGALQLEEPKL